VWKENQSDLNANDMEFSGERSEFIATAFTDNALRRFYIWN
jgi:hypothetical protein